jgi:hypothetical protein
MVENSTTPDGSTRRPARDARVTAVPVVARMSQRGPRVSGFTVPPVGKRLNWAQVVEFGARPPVL